MNQVRALAATFGVKPATVRQWIRRDLIRRNLDGSLDIDSLEKFVKTRVSLDAGQPMCHA